MGFIDIRKLTLPLPYPQKKKTIQSPPLVKGLPLGVQQLVLKCVNNYHFSDVFPELKISLSLPANIFTLSKQTKMKLKYSLFSLSPRKIRQNIHVLQTINFIF